MPNMSYCRFENTAADLADCLEHFDEELSKTEDKARNNIIAMAVQIAEAEGIAKEALSAIEQSAEVKALVDAAKKLDALYTSWWDLADGSGAIMLKESEPKFERMHEELTAALKPFTEASDGK